MYASMHRVIGQVAAGWLRRSSRSPPAVAAARPPSVGLTTAAEASGVARGEVDVVRLDVDDNVATITLDHPVKRNALSSTMLRGLGRRFAEVAARDDARVIVVRSSSDVVFSSGHDLKELTSGPGGDAQGSRDELERLFKLCSEVMLQVHYAPQPVIAEISGVATAAGCH